MFPIHILLSLDYLNAHSKSLTQLVYANGELKGCSCLFLRFSPHLFHSEINLDGLFGVKEKTDAKVNKQDYKLIFT